VLGLAVDLDAGLVAPFCEELGVDFPVLLATPEVSEGREGSLGPLRVLPMAIVIGRDGRVVRTLVGPEAHQRLQQVVEGAL